VDVLIEEGFLSYEDVAVLTPAELCEMGGMDEDTAADMIAFADEEAQEVERVGKPAKTREQLAGASAGGAPPPRQEAPATGRQAFENLFASAPRLPEPAAAAQEVLGSDQAVETPPEQEAPVVHDGEPEDEPAHTTSEVAAPAAVLESVAVAAPATESAPAAPEASEPTPPPTGE
jgi:N utilization substance protein A